MAGFRKIGLMGAVAMATAGLGAGVTAQDAGARAVMKETERRARRQQFDAEAEIECAQEQGEALGLCQTGVARGAGAATLAVTFANGFTRYLFFAGGDFVAGNPTMSGAGRDTDWDIVGGAHVIRVDDQRFVVPVPLLSGE